MICIKILTLSIYIHMHAYVFPYIYIYAQTDRVLHLESLNCSRNSQPTPDRWTRPTGSRATPWVLEAGEGDVGGVRPWVSSCSLSTEMRARACQGSQRRVTGAQRQQPAIRDLPKTLLSGYAMQQNAYGMTMPMQAQPVPRRLAMKQRVRPTSVRCAYVTKY